MKKFKLEEMKNGWFIGDFIPSVLRTKDFEIAIKEYKKGNYEGSHHHKLATEITVVVFGRVRMGATEYLKGDLVLTEPLECTDFEALEDTITVVVKYPSVSQDKYIESEFV